MKNTPEKTQQNCKTIENLLGAYVFKDLSAADIIRVENHLDHCEICRADVAGMRRVVESLKDELTAEDAPVLGADFHQQLSTLPVCTPRKKSIFHFPGTRVILQVAATFVGLAALWMFIIPGLFTAERQYSKNRLDKCAEMQDTYIPLEYNAYPAETVDAKPLDAEVVDDWDESNSGKVTFTVPPRAPVPIAVPAPDTGLDFDGASITTVSEVRLPGLYANRSSGRGSIGVAEDKSGLDFSDEAFDGVTNGASTVTQFYEAKKGTSFKVLTDGTKETGKNKNQAAAYPLGGKAPVNGYELSVGGTIPAPQKAKSGKVEIVKWKDTNGSKEVAGNEEGRRKDTFAAGPEAKPIESLTVSGTPAPAEPTLSLSREDDRVRRERQAETLVAGLEKTRSLNSRLPKAEAPPLVVVVPKDSEGRDDDKSYSREANSKTGTVVAGEDFAEGDDKLMKQALADSERPNQAANLPVVDLPAEKEEAQELPVDGPAKRLTDLSGNWNLEDVQEAWFKHLPVNPFQLTAQDNQSTFGLDTDTASYRIAQNYLRNNQLPPKGAIRMEEFVNAFDYNYPRGNQVFNIHVEGAPSPFRKNLKLLKIGIQGKIIGREARKSGRFVFLIDTSGSMARNDRMPLVIHSIELLLNQLGEKDTLSVITYGPEPALILDAVSPREKKRILSTLKAIQCGGSTNLYKGVQLAYETAQRHFQAQAVNRIVLFSDGATNVGPTDSADLLSQVSVNRHQGINFTSIGFGLGDYNDEILEALANKGDGNYLFVGTPEEARQALVENMAATAQHIAKDAKIQVEFNKDKVRRYRLIGYENRDIADKDFRNDSVDAGEVASGQSVTALYELELFEQTDPEFNPDLGTVYVRYRNMETNRIEEISQRITPDVIQNLSVKKAPRFFLAASAAEFAEQLRGSEYVQGSAVSDVRHLLEQVAVELPLDKGIQTLLKDVRQAEKLTGRQTP